MKSTNVPGSNLTLIYCSHLYLRLVCGWSLREKEFVSSAFGFSCLSFRTIADPGTGRAYLTTFPLFNCSLLYICINVVEQLFYFYWEGFAFC